MSPKHLLCSIVMILSMIRVYGQPSRHVALMANPNAGRILSSGALYDQFLVDSLKAHGYEVTITYPGLDDFSFDFLACHDLVIIGRSSRSSNFQQLEAWTNLQTPIISLSGYLPRSVTLNWVAAPILKGPNGADDSTAMDIIRYASIIHADDPIFSDVDTSGNIAYKTWFYDYLDYSYDQFLSENNGKLLAYLTPNQNIVGEGSVLVARWSPNEATYEGSGVIPKGYRTYLQMGTDNDVFPNVTLNHNQFTKSSYQMFWNEIDFLINQPRESEGCQPTLSADSRLGWLEINGEMVKFNASDSLINIELDTSQSISMIRAGSANLNSTMELTQTDQSPERYTIVITAQDETTSRYTVVRTYPAPKNPVLTHQDEVHKMTVFPTVFHETITVRGASHIAAYEVYGMDGRRVAQGQSSENVLHLSHLEKGAYLLKILVANRLLQQRIIKN